MASVRLNFTPSSGYADSGVVRRSGHAWLATASGTTNVANQARIYRWKGAGWSLTGIDAEHPSRNRKVAGSNPCRGVLPRVQPSSQVETKYPELLMRGCSQAGCLARVQDVHRTKYEANQ